MPGFTQCSIKQFEVDFSLWGNSGYRSRCLPAVRHGSPAWFLFAILWYNTRSLTWYWWCFNDNTCFSTRFFHITSCCSVARCLISSSFSVLSSTMLFLVFTFVVAWSISFLIADLGWYPYNNWKGEKPIESIFEFIEKTVGTINCFHALGSSLASFAIDRLMDLIARSAFLVFWMSLGFQIPHEFHFILQTHRLRCCGSGIPYQKCTTRGNPCRLKNFVSILIVAAPSAMKLPRLRILSCCQSLLANNHLRMAPHSRLLSSGMVPAWW